MARIWLKHTTGRYPIISGSGAIGDLSSTLRKYAPESRLFVFYDANFFALHGRAVKKALKGSKLKSVELVLPSGERTKSQVMIGHIHDYMLSEQITRNDFVLACGGGVLSDLVGYAAATVMRGVPWGAVATTLLSMVDASVGGKTGINHRLGKNMIGAFWQPKFVISDIDFLATLSRREFVGGLGECVKYAGLIGDESVTGLAQYLAKSEFGNRPRLARMVKESTAYKAMVVEQDERDGGRRMILNLGHTFGHAIENTLGYGRLRHGEAVIIGLLAMTELSLYEGHSIKKRLQPYRNLVQDFITLLPRRRLEPAAICDAMRLDKKRTSNTRRFILLERPGRPIIVNNPLQRNVRRAVDSAVAFYTEHGGSNV